jgi:23S rRNA G2445 N2-methylase RlmL
LCDVKKIKPRLKKSKVYGFDSQLRYLKAAQKNCKLAGVEVNLSKADVEWLDTKFEKNSVDLIVSDPPRMSKHKDIKKLNKVYNELFYQADYILKKKGKVVLLVKDDTIIEAAEKHKFKIDKSSLLNQGKDIFKIISFVRG